MFGFFFTDHAIILGFAIQERHRLPDAKPREKRVNLT